MHPMKFKHLRSGFLALALALAVGVPSPAVAVVSSTTSRVAFAGDGVSTAFATGFYFLANADLTVILRSSTGVETTQTITTHYTVSGAGNPAGGTVTMVTAPASGATLTIIRTPPLTQLTDLVANDPLPAETVEQTLDKQMMVEQRTRDLVDRKFGVADTVPTVPAALNKTAAERASQFLSFDSSGNLTVASGTGTDSALRTDLASTTAGKGASLVSIEDAAGAYTGTTLEVALTEVVTKANTQTITGAKTFSAAATFDATVNANAASAIVAEGTTADAFETTLSFVDPTADNTITFPNETGTVVTNLAASLKPLTSDTVQATTSGTAFSFTGIPSWVKRITIMFSGVSLSGTDLLLVELGDSGGFEGSGYVASAARLPNAAATAVASSGGGFIMYSNAAADVVSGAMTLTLIDAATNTWVSEHAGKASTTIALTGGGNKSLSATLDRLRITRSIADTFDAGSVNILYE